MVNEVEETIKCIHDSIGVHNHELNRINTAVKAVNLNDHILIDLKRIIIECCEFKAAFHRHQLDGLNEAEKEIGEKYGLC